jgi:single-stranded-DNA-specific exonuclease
MVDTPKLTVRPTELATTQHLEAAGIHPLLARLWASRGVKRQEDVLLDWPALLAPSTLTQAIKAASLLADSIQSGQRMLIVADYDCDGATACAVAMRALTEMGAVVDFLVPNRFETGYGLSPAVVELAVKHPSGRPDLLITVDNGIASVEGVAASNALGIGVIVTDHRYFLSYARLTC